MACRSRHLIVHCAAPGSVLGDVIPVNPHEHEHSFADLTNHFLVDGDARALDSLEDEPHCGCVCCKEQWQQSCARQLELSVQKLMNYSDGVASAASTRVVLAVAPRWQHATGRAPL